MWTAIISFLGGPLLSKALDAYRAKLDAGNTRENIAAELAGRELAVQQREIEVDAEYKRALVGHWYEPTNLFGYIMVIYFGKAILFDKVIASMVGADWATDPIKGDLATWAGMIMVFFVGKRGVENVARILKK